LSGNLVFLPLLFRTLTKCEHWGFKIARTSKLEERKNKRRECRVGGERKGEKKEEESRGVIKVS